MIIAKDSRGKLAQDPARDRRPKRAKQQPQRCPGRGELRLRIKIGGSPNSASSVPHSLTLRQSQKPDPRNLIYFRKARLPVITPHSRAGPAEHLFRSFNSYNYRSLRSDDIIHAAGSFLRKKDAGASKRELLQCILQCQGRSHVRDALFHTDGKS